MIRSRTTRNLSIAALVAAAHVSAATYSAYVMGYFKESPNGSSNSSRLHLAVSKDGLNWLPLNQNNHVVQPALGTKALRDPFFHRMPDGSFTIVATDNWNSEHIHIWSSPDLRSFTDERLVRMNSTKMHSWAPEVFWDEGRKQHAIIWSGNTDRNRIYVSYTTDFKTVTSPAIFFDPGFSVIDGHMEVGVDGWNYLYFKDERDWKLYGTRSTSLAARSFDANKFSTGHGAPFKGSHTEAPIVVRGLDGKKWWLWGDSYNPINAVFYAWEASTPYTNSWTAVGRRDYTAPPNAKHATIVPITSAEYDNLVAKWGRPAFEIVKSYRIPTAFVRHANNTGRISNHPFDPIADMQWKVVPGLADPDGISFESMNVPGSYLRQSNNIVGLAANDNSANFKSNATFLKAPGFANASWVSLKSHAVPDRYLRQASDSTLRLDPITSASSSTDKEDATFQLVYASINAAKSVHVSPDRTSVPERSAFRFDAARRVAIVDFDTRDAAPSRLDVFDARGAKLDAIDLGETRPGSNQAIWDAKDATPGVYSLRIDIGSNESRTGRIVIP